MFLKQWILVNSTYSFLHGVKNEDNFKHAKTLTSYVLFSLEVSQRCAEQSSGIHQDKVILTQIQGNQSKPQKGLSAQWDVKVRKWQL